MHSAQCVLSDGACVVRAAAAAAHGSARAHQLGDAVLVHERDDVQPQSAAVLLLVHGHLAQDVWALAALPRMRHHIRPKAPLPPAQSTKEKCTFISCFTLFNIASGVAEFGPRHWR